LFGNSTGTGLFGAKPEGSSLFGNGPSTSLFGGAPVGKSLFDSKNSLFGGQTNIFAKAAENKKDEKSDGGESPVYAEEDEPPTVTLGEYKGIKSPFEKVFEKEVQKFKISTPIEQKKNCGIGKTSI
jgi:hypothetical protein